MISANRISKALLFGASLVIMAASSVADSDVAPTKSQQIDKIFAQWDNDKSPGCLAFAFQDGKILMSKGYGMADMAWSQPIADDTVFYLASTSKQFAAAAIALLILDGKLSLDEDVHKYVPELPDFGHLITVRNLVYHTSGIRDYLTLVSLAGRDDPLSNQKTLDLLSKQSDLNFPPGSEWSYSNSGYVLLSVIVERISGKTLGAFSRERIFDPLGMDNANWDNKPETLVKNRARSYSKNSDGKWIRHPKTIAATGDGNLLATVGDLLRWDENFYRAKVGGKAFLDLIQKPGMNLPNSTVSYAFGLMVNDQHRGQKMIHHGGAFSGFRIQLTRFPEQHFSSGVLCNTADADSSQLAIKIADVYLNKIFDPMAETVKATAPPEKPSDPPYELSPDQLQEYVGTYHNKELDINGTVTVVDGALLFSGMSQKNLPLIPKSNDKFMVMYNFAPGVSFPIKFDATRDANNKVDQFILDIMRVKNFRMKKVK